MTSPVWMNAVIAEFGRAAGIGDLALNERGAAALKFNTGVDFRLEYTGSELVMSMSVAKHVDMDVLKRLLTFSHPMARHGFRVRTGCSPKTHRPTMAIRFAERDVTLPAVNAAFAVLWRLAEEIGGAA